MRQMRLEKLWKRAREWGRRNGYQTTHGLVSGVAPL